MLKILDVLSLNMRLKSVNLSWNVLVKIKKPPQAGTYHKEELLDLGRALPSEMIKLKPEKEKKKRVSIDSTLELNTALDSRETRIPTTKPASPLHKI